MEATMRNFYVSDENGQLHLLSTEEFIADGSYYRKTISINDAKYVIEDFIDNCIVTTGEPLPQITLDDMKQYFSNSCPENLQLALHKAGLEYIVIDAMYECKSTYINDTLVYKQVSCINKSTCRRFMHLITKARRNNHFLLTPATNRKIIQKRSLLKCLKLINA